MDIFVDRVHEKGEQIFLNYGAHSNPFLLVEYGFMLEDNPNDRLSLDSMVLMRLNESEKNMLESMNYLGNYSIGKDGSPDYRLEVVLHLLISPFLGSKTDYGLLKSRKRLEDFINGNDETEGRVLEVREYLSSLMKDKMKEIQKGIDKVTSENKKAELPNFEAIIQTWVGDSNIVMAYTDYLNSKNCIL